MNKMLHMIAFILIIIGGLNWLIVGLSGQDLFQYLGMQMSDMIPKVVYVLVGLSAIYLVVMHKKDCKMCMGGSSGQGAMM